MESAAAHTAKLEAQVTTLKGEVKQLTRKNDMQQQELAETQEANEALMERMYAAFE